METCQATAWFAIQGQSQRSLSQSHGRRRVDKWREGEARRLEETAAALRRLRRRVLGTEGGDVEAGAVRGLRRYQPFAFKW